MLQVLECLRVCNNSCSSLERHKRLIGFFVFPGAQIRGNLDMLEGWASEVGLQEEATDYLRKLSSAADVIATPKVQLLQVSRTVAVSGEASPTIWLCYANLNHYHYSFL